jgi:hypothetical protein
MKYSLSFITISFILVSSIFAQSRLYEGPLEPYLKKSKEIDIQQVNTKSLINFYKQNRNLFAMDTATESITVLRKCSLYGHWSEILLKQPDKEKALDFLYSESEKSELYNKINPNWNEVAVIATGGNYGMIASTIVNIEGVKGFTHLYNSAGNNIAKIKFIISRLDINKETDDAIKKQLHSIVQFATPEIKDLIEEYKKQFPKVEK